MTSVSVLLPVHNGERYLKQALQSILNQTHRDFELLVVDDGSSDGSGQMARSLGDARVRVITNERNLGLPETLNRGLREARFGIVARQDADDLSHPERLARQVAFLDAHPDVGLLGTQAWVIDEVGRCLGSVEHATRHQSLLWELMFDNAFVHTSVAFRRDVVLDLGGYDAAWPYNQDYDLWMRLSARARVANLPERLVAWRTHGDSMTRTMGVEAAASNRRILSKTLSLLPETVSAEVVELVARAQHGLVLGDLRALTPLLRRWATQYEAKLNPTTREDFRRTLSRQYINLAFSRRGRSFARVASALWSGRSHAGDLASSLFSLLAEKTRLRFGHDPLARFNVAV